MDELNRYPAVRAVDWSAQVTALVERCVEIQQIPAPTYQEAERAQFVAEKFRGLGLAHVDEDEMYNVYGCVPGHRSQPALLVSAHTDTVFGVETDLQVRKDDEDGSLHGPGIGDNSCGVAALWSLAEALMRPGMDKPPVDIWLVANSTEEGLGDLRGMRAALDRLRGQIGACIVIEGMGLGRIVHRGLGSRRFRIEIEAPGGHSWSDFGAASAIHTLMHMGHEISRLSVPATPRTTFNLGRVSGGTSINTIAQHAAAELDLRSEDTVALQTLVHQVEEIVSRYQTSRWQRRGVEVRLETIGDRPPGEIGPEHPLVRAAMATLQVAAPARVPDLRISSTDANIPLSRGIPAVCIGVTDGGHAHRLQEWIHTAPLGEGMAHLWLLTWWSAVWLDGQAGEKQGAPANRSGDGV